jgi:LPXTG-motif cell wall-anchored protein
MNIRYRSRHVARTLIAFGITLGFLLVAGSANAADEVQSPAATKVTVEYLQSSSGSAIPGFTVVACPKDPPTPQLQVSCPEGAPTFTSLGYDPLTAQQQVTITVQAEGTTALLDLVYDVTLNPPAAPTADSKIFDVPFTQGSQATIGFTDFSYTCPGCSENNGPSFEAVGVNPGNAGQASFDAVRGLVFTPAPDFTGRVDISYVVTDPFGQKSKRGTLTIDYVEAATQAPITTIDTLSVRKNTTGTVNILANDAEPGGGSLSLLSCGQPAHGQVSCSPDGAAVYTPNVDYTGLDQFSYVVSNASGDQATGTVVVGVETDATTIVERATETIRSNTTTVTPTVSNIVQHVSGAVPAKGSAAVVGVFGKLNGALTGVNGQFSSGLKSAGMLDGELANTGSSTSWTAAAAAGALIALGAALLAGTYRSRRRGNTRVLSFQSASGTDD